MKKPHGTTLTGGPGGRRQHGRRHTGRVIPSSHEEDRGVRLQVHEPVNTGPGHLTVIVRCMESPTHLHARFHRVNDSTAIDLELVGIEVYDGITLGQIDPAWSARVTLTGTGSDLIRAGDMMHGTNP